MTSSEVRNQDGERIDHTFHPGSRLDALVILGHGVTGNKDRPLLVAVAEGLAERGWPCLRISYTGNGESEGRFGDSCITKETGDLASVIDDVPQDVKIAYVGHSMGGAVGVMTAAKDARIRTLVSLAGMTHTADFVKREFGDVVPGEGFMWDDEECPLSQAYVDDLTGIGSTLESAAKVVQPWLLVHGVEDDVVPIKDGEDAFAAAISEKEWLPIGGAGHSFDENSYGRIVDAVDAWLTRHLG
ncbi:MAG TPA: alpha/beta fold hydrolase [Luteolibacter sp.]|nr:alpha/beta fold hydrolase [Luteolibacter sp.]